MEEAFEKLKKEGKNDVDHLVQWMKDSKLIEDTKASEQKLRALFENEKNKQCVELANFKAALTKLAEEQQKTMQEFADKIVAQGPIFIEALVAAAAAARETLANAQTNQKK